MAQEKEILRIDLDVKQLLQAATETKKQIDELATKQKELTKSGQDNTIEFQQNAQQLRTLKKEYADTTKAADNQTKASNTQTGEIERLRAILSIATKQYNGLSKAELENAEIGGKLTNEIKTTSDKLKELEGAIGDNRRGVGDYVGAILKANSEIEKMKKETNDLILAQKKVDKSTDEGKEAFNQLNIAIQNNIIQINNLSKESGVAETNLKKLKESSEGGADALDQADEATGGFIQGIKGMISSARAFIATPLGAILAAVALAVIAVKKAFESSREGQEKWAKVMGVVNGLLAVLNKALIFVGEKLISIFENPQKALSDFGNLIKENIVNLFNGLLELFPQLGKAMSLLFKGEFSEAGKVATNAVAKVGLVVDNITDKVSNAAKELKDFTDLQINNATKLTQAELKLEQARREQRKTQLNFQADAEKLRQIRDDEARSIPERIKANEALGDVLKKQLNTELELQQQALDVAKLRVKLDGETKENLDEVAQAETELADIRERVLGQESEQLVNRNSLLREQMQVTKALADVELKITQDLIDAKLRNMADGVEKEIAIEKERLRGVLKTIEGSSEIEEELKAQLRIESANKIKEFEAKQEEERKQREAQKAEKIKSESLLKLDNDLAELQLRGQLTIEAETAIENQRFEILKQNKELTNEQLRQLTLDHEQNLTGIKEKEVENRKKLDANQLGSAMNLLSSLSQLTDLAAEQSEDAFEFSKALRISMAIIDGLGAVQLALASSPPPLNFVNAAAVAITTGVNVAKIASTNFQGKKAKGGIIGGKSHSEGGTVFTGSDGSVFEAERGELLTVVNKKNTSLLGSLSNLNSFNGNGVPFFQGKSYLADGGIVARSATKNAIDQFALANAFKMAASSLPAPVVSVTDITDVAKKVQAIQNRANI